MERKGIEEETKKAKQKQITLYETTDKGDTKEQTGKSIKRQDNSRRRDKRKDTIIKKKMKSFMD